MKKIDKAELNKVLDGVKMTEDESAYVKMVTNMINSKEKHTIEYVGDKKTTSSEGAEAFDNYTKKIGIKSSMLDPEGNLNVSALKGSGGDGLNLPTPNGSHTFIMTNKNSITRSITSGHELFGYGLPSARKESDAANNANAIRADNLIRRLLQQPQRDGADHAGYKLNHITQPQKLPYTE